MHQTIRARSRVPLSAGVVAVALAAAVAGCGSSKSTTTTTRSAVATSTSATTTPATTTATTATTATTPTTTTASDNGVAARSAEEILAATTAAAKGASAVHVAGGDGSSIQLDLNVVRGKGGSGSIAQGGNQFQIISSGSRVFLRGSDAFYTRVGGSGAAQLLKGRWLSGPVTGQFASIAALTDMDRLLAQVVTPSGGKITRGAAATVDGQKAIALIDTRVRGGTLYVATTGKPYPIEILANGKRGRIIFDKWDQAVAMPAPADSIDITTLRSGATKTTGG